MKSKRIIVLRGLGGNFKSSIAKILVPKGYIMIPEGNREFETELDASFNRRSDTELNYVAKYIMIKGLLTNDFDKYVSDRGLVDAAIINQLIKTHLTHYEEAYRESLNPEMAYQKECELFAGYEVINVLLRTTDKNFLNKIIDNSFDIRACFYDNTETYLQCQEVYTNFIRSHYKNIIEINIDKVPEADKYSDAIHDYVEDIVKRILNEIDS